MLAGERRIASCEAVHTDRLQRIRLAEDEIQGGAWVEVLHRDAEQAEGVVGGLLFQNFEDVGRQQLSVVETRSACSLRPGVSARDGLSSVRVDSVFRG
jgi:hypothetical protein